MHKVCLTVCISQLLVAFVFPHLTHLLKGFITFILSHVALELATFNYDVEGSSPSYNICHHFLFR